MISISWSQAIDHWHRPVAPPPAEEVKAEDSPAEARVMDGFDQKTKGW